MESCCDVAKRQSKACHLSLLVWLLHCRQSSATYALQSVSKKKRFEVWSSALVLAQTAPLKWERRLHLYEEKNILIPTLRVSIRANCCRLAERAFKDHWTSCQIEPLLSRERGVCMCERVCVRACVFVCLLICRREVAGLCVRMIWFPSLT